MLGPASSLPTTALPLSSKRHENSIVVSDVKQPAFGYNGKSHWRDVLGGHERFICRDLKQETRTVEWGLPYK